MREEAKELNKGMGYFSETCSVNKPTWYAMKTNLGRKIRYISSEIEDQIGGDDDLQLMFII